jgi:hypothetical protein
VQERLLKARSVDEAIALFREVPTRPTAQPRAA